MTGSLQIKNDKYYAVLNIIEGGKRKQKWISTGLDVKGHKRQAERMLREIILDYEKSNSTFLSNITLSDYINIWLCRKEPTVEPNTFIGYKRMAESRIIPYFQSSGLKIVDVDRFVLQSFFDDVFQLGRLDGKGVITANTIKHLKNIINQVLNEAVKDDLIPSNPCLYINLPKIQKYQSQFYNPEQLKKLFSSIEGDVIAPLVKITALYGLRRSEVLGIKWDSIDSQSRKLTIKHTVIQAGEIFEKDTTKNSSSFRTFSLCDEALEIFANAKRVECENRRLFGMGYIENDYVFKWDNGAPFQPDYISRHFNIILKKNNLPHIRFHELRHSCASLLLNNGFTLKDVQDYMGHADIQMTANIYGHLDSSRKTMLTNNISSSIF